MNDVLKQDDEILRALSEKLISKNIAVEEQEQLLELLGRYDSKDLQNSLKSIGLLSHDIAVIKNFHDNIKAFSNLIINNDPVILRSFFFSGKKVNDGLLSPAYRHVLNYVQNDATLKVKTEIFFDIHSYFKYDCFEEDLANDKELKELDAKVRHLKKGKKTIDLLALSSNELNSIEDLEISGVIHDFCVKIKTLNLSRNMGVRVVSNKNNDLLSVTKDNDSYINKIGIAKSGYIDCMKKTPRGLVVAMGTSDSSLNFQSEREQLTRHVAALGASILRKEFGDYTDKDLYAIDFYSLTGYKRKHDDKLQESLVGLGIEVEMMSFLNHCLSYVLKSPQISEEMKSKISYQGILCASLENKDLSNLEGTLNSLLGKVLAHQDEIIEQVKNREGLSFINGYFSNIAEFIEKNSQCLEIKDHNSLIDKMRSLVNLSRELGIPSVDLRSSISNLSPDFQKARYKDFKEILNEDRIFQEKKQIDLKNDILRQKEEILSIVVKRYGIDLSRIMDKAKYNHLTAKRRTSENERKKLGLALKGDIQFNKSPSSFTSFSPAERLYCHLAGLDENLAVNYGYNSKLWNPASPTSTEAKEIKMFANIVNKLDMKNSSALPEIGKVWTEDEVLKGVKKNRQRKP